MSRAATQSGARCRTDGTTLRYVSNGGCVACARRAKAHAGRLGAEARIAALAARRDVLPDPITQPYLYYTSKRFSKCEWCGRQSPRIVCLSCVDKLAGRVPEAYQRDNDFSDVRRVLLEMAS